MTDPAKIKSLLRQLAAKQYKVAKILPVVRPGTPQHQKWAGFYARYGLSRTGFQARHDKWTVPCEFPPEHEGELEEMVKVRLAR